MTQEKDKQHMSWRSFVATTLLTLGWIVIALWLVIRDGDLPYIQAGIICACVISAIYIFGMFALNGIKMHGKWGDKELGLESKKS
jgi:hypothetical protein